MPRKGRELEQLVAILEESLGPKGIIIKSPDYLIDKDTKERREVDISLRSKVGSFEILAIIECRDRDEVQDVRWIEELASKCKSVGADKIVAVSSDKFSSGAIKKAECLSIDIRTMNNIDAKEIAEWFECKEGIHLISHASFIDLVIELRNGQRINARGIDIDSPLFEKKANGDKISFRDIWDAIPKPYLYYNVPEDGTHMQYNIRLDYIEEGKEVPSGALTSLENLKFPAKNGSVDIAIIYILAELWQDAEKVPYIVKRYENADGSIAEVIEFEYEENGKLFNTGLLNFSSSGEKRIYLLPKGHKEPGKADFRLTFTDKADKTKFKDYIFRLEL